jgi:hypothetical protein
MATLWVREYSQIGYDGAARLSQSGVSGAIPVPKEPGTDQTPVTFSTSAQSAAFASGTVCVRIVGSAAFHYVVGANPTATTSHMKHPADTPLDIGVTPGQKIAAIAAA